MLLIVLFAAGNAEAGILATVAAGVAAMLPYARKIVSRRTEDIGKPAQSGTLAVRLPALPPLPPWVASRARAVTEVADALLRPDGELVTGTGQIRRPVIALVGMGGMGKTILANMVGRDSRIIQQYSGRVEWVDVRPGAEDDALATVINDLIKKIGGVDATIRDPGAAGRALASLLEGGAPRLLILNDVWQPAQLEAFTQGNGGYAVLVTTRSAEVCKLADRTVTVGRLTQDEASDLLTHGGELLGLAANHELIAALLTATGRWALLVSMVRRQLASRVALGEEPVAAASSLLFALNDDGFTGVDENRTRPALPDVADERSRNRAVRATIEATRFVGHRDSWKDDLRRLGDLVVFAAGKPVPFGVVTLLWQATCGLGGTPAERLCAWLEDAGLLLVTPGEGVELHDVIRDYLSHERETSMAKVNRDFLDAVAAAVSNPAAATKPWWELNGDDNDSRYLRTQLIWHLLADGRRAAARELATDPRWIGVRLQHDRITGVLDDLSQVGGQRAERLRSFLISQQHLLEDTDPPAAVVDILYSRLAADPEWGPQVRTKPDSGARPRLVSRWPGADPPSALRRELTCGSAVSEMAVDPEGKWLAIGCRDGTVGVWDTAAWKPVVVFPAHDYMVGALAFSPDGQWLATGHGDLINTVLTAGTIRIWDTASWELLATVDGHEYPVTALAFSPDRRVLVTGSDSQVCLWSLVAGDESALALQVIRTLVMPGTTRIPGGEARVIKGPRTRGMLTERVRFGIGKLTFAGDGRLVTMVDDGGRSCTWDTGTWAVELPAERYDGSRRRAAAVTPDGEKAAFGESIRGPVIVEDTTTRRTLAKLPGHPGRPVTAMAFARDGSWLATGADDGKVRLWDTSAAHNTAAGRQIAMVAAAPDGSWVAAGGDHEVRILDPWTGEPREVFRHYSLLAMSITPDASRLVTAGMGGVKDWNTAAGEATEIAPRLWATSLEVSLDGARFAAGCSDGTTWIWDAVNGQPSPCADGHEGSVTALAFSADGRRMATGGEYGSIRILDAGTGRLTRALPNYARGEVSQLAFIPGRNWLATCAIDAVRIWDLTTGQPLSAVPRVCNVRAIGISRDGTLLATGGTDGTVRLWTLRAGDAGIELVTMMRIEGPVASCAWLGARGLAVAGMHGVYLFDLTTDH